MCWAVSENDNSKMDDWFPSDFPPETRIRAQPSSPNSTLSAFYASGKVREARCRCHFAARNHGPNYTNYTNLKWLHQRWGVGAKTSLCPSVTVVIMYSQELQMGWTTLPWSQPGFFRTVVWNRSIRTYPYYSILFNSIHTCHHLSILPKPAPPPAIS